MSNDITNTNFDPFVDTVELSELGKESRKDREKRLFQYISTDSETGRESCIFCQKVFSASNPSIRLRHAMDHIDSVHLKIMRYQCQFCGKKYPRMSQLCTHLKLKHPVGSKMGAISGNFDESSKDITNTNCDPCVDAIAFNPWQVESLKEFAYLKCPECPFDCKEDALFKDHALENHPMSIVLFGEQSNYEDFKVKEELPETSLIDEKDQDLIEFEHIKSEQKERMINSHSQNYDRENPNSCKICKISFLKKKEYRDHLTHLNKSGIKSLKCCACDKKYNFLCTKRLNNHIATVHEGKTIMQYKCSFCDEEFKTRAGMRDHKELEHLKITIPGLETGERAIHEGKKLRKCFFCDKTFSYWKVLKGHIDTEHEGKKPFNCSLCATGFLIKKNLLRHTQTVHEEKRPHKCSFCDKYFKTEDGVKNHSGKCVEHLKISPKLGPGERASCIQCDKTYVNKSALRQHVEVVHLKMKKFQCDQCPLTFASRKGFNYHMESKHEKKEHPCSKCDRIFKTKDCLNSHVLKHHEKRLDFKCEYCGSEFPTLSEVNRHIKVLHANNVKCELCDKILNNPKKLLKHKYIQHNEKNIFLRCDECPTSGPKRIAISNRLFLTQALLDKHKKKRH